jgi:hypothetical protein
MNNSESALEMRMLHPQKTLDFLYKTHEWRRIFAEAWGTFLLVMVAAGAGVVAAKSNGAVTLGMAVVAPGLMVMAIIYFMGTVSGAHLNPAVTLAFAARRNFPWCRCCISKNVPGLFPFKPSDPKNPSKQGIHWPGLSFIRGTGLGS